MSKKKFDIICIEEKEYKKYIKELKKIIENNVVVVVIDDYSILNLLYLKLLTFLYGINKNNISFADFKKIIYKMEEDDFTLYCTDDLKSLKRGAIYGFKFCCDFSTLKFQLEKEAENAKNPRVR